MSEDRARFRILSALGIVVLLLLACGYFIPHTFAAVLTSVALSYLVNPILKYLERRGFDRVTALALLYGIGAFTLFLASFVFIPYLGHQLDALGKALPGYVQSLDRFLDQWKVRLSTGYLGQEGTWLLTKIEKGLDDLVHVASGFGYRQLKGLLFGLFDLILSPILVFFMLLYKVRVKDVIKRLFHHEERHFLMELGRTINRTLERFIIGMCIDCLLVGLLTAALLAFLDVEFPVLNGLFAGFASVVPLIGVMVAVVPAALIGYARSGDLMIIPKVCAAYFIINVIIEGNLIKPLVMRGALRLNPLVVIFSLMAMGELLGFWGVLIAIPLAAVLKICTVELHRIVQEDERGNL